MAKSKKILMVMQKKLLFYLHKYNLYFYDLEGFFGMIDPLWPGCTKR